MRVVYQAVRSQSSSGVPYDSPMADPTDDIALAVDVGGTKVDAALVTGAGRVLRGSVARRPTGRGRFIRHY